MKIFVASWFFPPSTSSEGIVTYKLLRNSSNQYDVVSSSSDQWGYSEQIICNEDNINIIPIDTNDLNTWRDETIKLFFEKNEKEHYDAIMTRCMPNESLEIGLAVKEKIPSMKWICSLADPVADNPYWLFAIQNIPELSDETKKQIFKDLKLPKDKWSQDWLKHPSNSVRDQFYWKEKQDESLAKADLLITPSYEQCDYMDVEGTSRHKFLIVPHSFDEDLFDSLEDNSSWEKEKVHFTYTGYSDSLRSLNPFVEAVKWIKIHSPQALEKIRFHFIGNYPREIVDRAYAYQIEDVFDFSGNASYLKTLELMKQSDWLLHVDAWFGDLKSTGGSIFFAGKLADYMGAHKPVLALTGSNSPAGNIVSKYGGFVVETWNTYEIAHRIIEIALGAADVQINDNYRRYYDAKDVALLFDKRVDQLCFKRQPSETEIIVGKTEYKNKKLLTICVPSFNSQSTLARTLKTLVNTENLSKIQIIIVDDGSHDGTFVVGEEYVNLYPDSIMMVSKPNGGHGSGINTGIKYAVGTYYRVVDSDDWVDSSALDAELGYIYEHGSKTDLIYTPYHIVDQETGNSSAWPLSEKIQKERIYTFDELVKEVGVENFYFTMAGTSFRTEMLRTINIQLMEKTFYTDSEFILKPIPYVDKVVFLPKYVYKYLRGQAEQSVAPLSFVRHYSDHEKILKELILFEKKTEMSESKRQYFTYILKQHLITNYRILTEFNPNTDDAVAKAKEFDSWLKENGLAYYSWADGLMNVRSLRRSGYSPNTIKQLQKKKNKTKLLSKTKLKNFVKKVIHSRLFLNRFTTGFIRGQKDNNGFLYRLYKRIK